MRKNNDKASSTELYEAILTLKTVDECISFFSDLCSITELKAMEQRYTVAKLLNKGQIYNAIMQQTGASSAIISRVNRALQYGADGYKTVLRRMDEKDSGEQAAAGQAEEA